MGKLLINNTEIETIKQRIEDGEPSAKVLSEYKISRQAYHQRLIKLGLKPKSRTRQGKIDEVDFSTIKDITNIYELAAALSLSFEDVHAISNNPKGIKAEIARLNHLYNNSPEKFKNEVFILILKHFEINPVDLIKKLSATNTSKY